MTRTIIKIDEELCDGCEACITGCHEGALQMIDGKARIVSNLFCDGLGACIADCPVGAISLEEREAEPYDEIATIQRIIPKGEKTIIAHLKHLKEHGETDYLKQGVNYLRANNIMIDFAQVHNHGGAGCNTKSTVNELAKPSACAGSREMTFAPTKGVNRNFVMASASAVTSEPKSQLRQWPIQLHLLNPEAAYFQNADVLLAADCVAFSIADFHDRFLVNKTLAIVCPKLDSNKESYVEKITRMITHSNINTLTVVIMEVPCCGSLISLAKKAVLDSGKIIPIKQIVVGIKGDILKEEWVFKRQA